jgi:hypothetical protein
MGCWGGGGDGARGISRCLRPCCIINGRTSMTIVRQMAMNTERPVRTLIVLTDKP